MPQADHKVSRAKSARTRSQVIQGALRALEARGVSATTTRDIAAESRVPLATLHYHFESKSALLLAVLDHLIDDTTAALRVEAQGSTDIATCIEEVLRGAWRFLIRTRDQQIVQYELTLYALREDAGWLAKRQYDAYVNLYRDILRGVAKQTKELDPEHCTDLARFILAGIDGLLLQQLARPNLTRSAKDINALTQSARAYAAALRREHRPRSDDAREKGMRV
jgi:AcrR family transcriptional regulator